VPDASSAAKLSLPIGAPLLRRPATLVPDHGLEAAARHDPAAQQRFAPLATAALGTLRPPGGRLQVRKRPAIAPLRPF
jgi:hypothetical protein